MNTGQYPQGRENQREVISYLPFLFLGKQVEKLLACGVYSVTLYFSQIRIRAMLWNRNSINSYSYELGQDRLMNKLASTFILVPVPT